MRFEYDGEKYFISFYRSFEEPKSPRIPTPKAAKFSLKKPNPTTYPSTTAKVLKVIGPNKGDLLIFQEATVGCYHKDKFSKEAGRLASLGAISDKLTQGAKGTPHQGWIAGFNRALWDAYTGRIPKLDRKPTTGKEDSTTK